jgi:hypothetical protein
MFTQKPDSPAPLKARLIQIPVEIGPDLSKKTGQQSTSLPFSSSSATSTADSKNIIKPTILLSQKIYKFPSSQINLFASDDNSSLSNYVNSENWNEASNDYFFQKQQNPPAPPPPPSMPPPPLPSFLSYQPLGGSSYLSSTDSKKLATELSDGQSHKNCHPCLCLVLTFCFYLRT